MSQVAQRSAPVHTVDADPVILKYPVVALRLAPITCDDEPLPRQSPVARARLEHQNRCCPRCRRITVQPVELDDALLNRKGEAIPNTATVTGFYCTTCAHEWSPQRLRLMAAEEC
ncbi:MAG: hypothetical protein JNG89_14605 [Planctomycetaceae bacterium]|nr:hypothetical protein [Planctomycetaceae bacterium]